MAKAKEGISVYGNVPVASFWFTDSNNQIVGGSRLRVRTNKMLNKSIGHVGYNVSPGRRGLGYGSEILNLTVSEASKLGLRYVLLIVTKDNLKSIRIIEKNSGILVDEIYSEFRKKKAFRYVIKT